MADVFVSYSAEDRPRVRPLVDALTAEGLSVWWDVAIAPGTAWRASIERELDRAACVIVVWSRASAGPDGTFVQEEAARAQGRGVLLPVTLDGSKPPLGFGHRQTLSLAGWRGARGDRRFREVAAAAKTLVAEGSPPAAERAPSERRPRLVPIALAGLAVVSLAAGLVWIGASHQGRLCWTVACGPLASRPASLAVLPFENLSGDPAQAYVSDGLTEELISTLSRLNALRVIARTSAFEFRESHRNLAEIAAKLGVTWLLEGSVRRQGSLMRVSAALVDPATGLERWSATYDRDARDILAVQSGIAQSVAEALRLKLLGGDLAQQASGDTLSPEAYDAYLRGRALVLQAASEADLREALRLFGQAINADARFAKAYMGEASAFVLLADRYVPENQIETAHEAASTAAARAAALAPSLPAAQAMYASILVSAKRDFAGAARAFERVHAASSGNAQVLSDYGVFRCQMNHCAEGAAALRQAALLDPLNPAVFYELGNMLFYARDYEAAIDAFSRSLSMTPKLAFSHGIAAEALMLSGDISGARAELAQEPTRWLRLTGEAILRHRENDEQGARQALQGVIADGGDANAYEEAEIYAQWGDRTHAFASLEKSLRLKDAGTLYLAVDPLLDPLRNDRRFARLRDLKSAVVAH